MGDIGLFRQWWKWFQSWKQVFLGSRAAVGCARERVVILADVHWPVVYSWFVSIGRLLSMLALHWKDFSVESLRSLLTLGSAALFVILWSFFLSLTSTTSLVYVLLCLAASGISVCYLGYTPGVFTIGLFGILIMRIYGYLWITGMLLIAGGYVLSLNHARILILMATTYAVYYVHACIGWHGVVLSLNLSFLSNDILNKLLQGCDSSDEATNFEQQREPESVLSDMTKKKDYDEQLRKEESGRVHNRSPGAFQQAGVEYRIEESRRIECTKCGNSHIWICTNRSKARARWCQGCSQYHQAKDGDGWVESGRSTVNMTPRKVEIPRAFVCAESKIFDVSEWASCQGVSCKPNTHGPSFQVNMVGLDRTGLRSNHSRYPWGLDAEMIVEDEDFERWLQQALASGVFSETPKRRKSWSPFKITQKGIKPWQRSP